MKQAFLFALAMIPACPATAQDIGRYDALVTALMVAGCPPQNNNQQLSRRYYSIILDRYTGAFRIVSTGPYDYLPSPGGAPQYSTQPLTPGGTVPRYRIAFYNDSRFPWAGPQQDTSLSPTFLPTFIVDDQTGKMWNMMVWGNAGGCNVRTELRELVR